MQVAARRDTPSFTLRTRVLARHRADVTRGYVLARSLARKHLVRRAHAGNVFLRARFFAAAFLPPYYKRTRVYIFLRHLIAPTTTTTTTRGFLPSLVFLSLFFRPSPFFLFFFFFFAVIYRTHKYLTEYLRSGYRCNGSVSIYLNFFLHTSYVSVTSFRIR